MGIKAFSVKQFKDRISRDAIRIQYGLYILHSLHIVILLENDVIARDTVT